MRNPKIKEGQEKDNKSVRKNTKNPKPDISPILLIFLNIVQILLNTAYDIFSRNPLLFLLLLQTVAAEMMAISVDEPETTAVCFRDIPGYPDDLGFRYHDSTGRDAFSPGMGFINQVVNCGLRDAPSNAEIIACLNKGVGLMALKQHPDGSLETGPLVETVEPTFCDELFKSVLRS